MSSVMQPHNHERKYRLLALGLGIVVAVFIVVIALTLLTKKSNNDNDKVRSDGQVADVVGTGTLDGNEQRGSGKIKTDCYSFDVPRSVSLGINQYCAVDFGYGSGEGNVFVISVVPMIHDENNELSFKKSLDEYKKQLQASGTKIDSEELIKLDGQDAVRLTNTQESRKNIVVFARTKTSDRLDKNGAIIEGILLTTPNYTKEQSEVMAGVVKTWKWQ